MGLIYRMHSEADIPELARLWSRDSGWDQIGSEAWRKRFMTSPAGEAKVSLAVNTADGRIDGQFIFIPHLLSCRDRKIPLWRPFAPVISRRRRGSLLPVIGMYRKAVQEIRAGRGGLIYMVPDPRWLPLLRRLPVFRKTSFPLWSLRLPMEKPFELPRGFRVRTQTGWDDRIDRLWREASQLHDCSSVRDSRFLSWKLALGDYEVLQIERGSSLKGLVASTRKGNEQWLICDLLAADAKESLEVTLMASCNLAHQAALDDKSRRSLHKAAILATPILQARLRKLGFERDDYDFPVLVHVLDRSLDSSCSAPDTWYFSAND